MNSDLTYIGFTHTRAPLAIRERVQPSHTQTRAMLDRLASFAAGRLVLSTCERFEVYASGGPCGIHHWINLFADWFHLPRRTVERYAAVCTGDAVAEHILRVAAGLDSRVLGEPQVLGQLRRAHEIALEADSLDPTLNALARSAIRTGRRVRAETDINQGRRSIASLAVEEVLSNDESPSEMRVAVLGTGHLARDVLASLSARGARNTCVIGRNEETGRSLAARFGARFIPLDALPGALRESEALIACTSAMTCVVEATMIETGRRDPLVLVDLCVPRNIEPGVQHLPGVRLLHLEELLRRSLPAVTGLASANQIVQDELNEFILWRKERTVAPIVVALMREAQKAGNKLTPSERRALHERIMRIKRGCSIEEVAA